MKIIDRKQGVISWTETVVRGNQFLFGALDVEIPGFAIAAEPGTYVRALKDGDTYVIEDRGRFWRLHLCAMKHADGYIIAPRPITVSKQPHVG